ncbi:hypothetical protein KSP39_PZI004108 [Platanthera zijinensis]|uniref:Uncharacterized protein n=1 Tax=Platanthera zijinensis TaxID=2320716 RepID=A0AAP0BWB3_9ASPA
MLQWTGGSRRKVATSRKSAHSRQKQYFEQRKRQRQAPGQEHRTNGSDMEVLYNAEPRSLDILNMINLAVAPKPVNTKLAVSANHTVANVSDNSLLGIVTGSYSTIVEGTRLTQEAKSSYSYLPEVSQIDSYKCAGHMNELKMLGSGPEHSSSCPGRTLNETNDKPWIESTILDLLDDGSFSNGRSIPEAHVALLVEGLGKIGSQTPAHSPRMQNRFSCKSTPMSSKASKRVRSSSALETSYNVIDEDLNAMIGDFRVSPFSLKGGSWPYVGTKPTTCKSNITPSPTFSHKDQLERTSIKGKGFDACLLPPNEKYRNDNFGSFKRQFCDESYMTSSPNQIFSFEGYSLLNSSAKKFEIYGSSDVEVTDTFAGSSRNLWEGSSKFEDSAKSTPYLRCSTLEREINPSFISDSGHTNADGNFDAPAWSLLPAEDYQDNTSPLSENSNSSAAARNKSSLGFGTCSVKPGKIKAKFSEKFPKVSKDGSFMGLCSEYDDIFDDAIWGEKQNSNSTFKMLGAESMFVLDQTFPSKTSSMLDPFNSFTPRNKSMASCGYEAMSQDDHFDPILMPKTKFETLSGCEPPNDFIYPHEISSKRSDFDLDSHVPTKPSSKTKGHVQYSSSAGGGFFKEIHFNHLPKYQEYNEERGSSGKPRGKDAEKRSTSSGNAESVAGVESLDKVSEHDHSRNEILEPSNSPGVEKLIDEAEVIPAMMEELPTQIQKYVQSKLNQFQGRSSGSSHRSNEEPKATHEPETKRFQTEGGGNGDNSYQVMLQSYVLQLLCVQKVLLEASGKDIKKA